MTAERDFTRGKLAWLSEVQADPSISPAAFMMAFAIAQHVNSKSGEAWPSQQTLARAVRMSERNVKNLIGTLKSAGHLIVTNGDGRGHTSRYRMSPERVNAISPFEDERRKEASPFAADEGRTDEAERVKNPARKGEPQFPQNTLKNTSKIDAEKKGPRKARDADGTEAQFQAFKGAYPSCENPQWSQARALFSAAIKRGVSPQEIIQGAAGFSVAIKKSGTQPKYVTRPYTWIRQQLWRDYGQSSDQPGGDVNRAAASNSQGAHVLNDDQWRWHITRFLSQSAWPASLGPDPDQPTCAAPAHIIRELKAKAA